MAPDFNIYKSRTNVFFRCDCQNVNKPVRDGENGYANKSEEKASSFRNLSQPERSSEIRRSSERRTKDKIENQNSKENSVMSYRKRSDNESLSQPERSSEIRRSSERRTKDKIENQYSKENSVVSYRKRSDMESLSQPERLSEIRRSSGRRTKDKMDNQNGKENNVMSYRKRSETKSADNVKRFSKQQIGKDTSNHLRKTGSSKGCQNFIVIAYRKRPEKEDTKTSHLWMSKEKDQNENHIRKLSQRISELANPPRRSENPYNDRILPARVSTAAQNYVATDRIIQLATAKPHLCGACDHYKTARISSAALHYRLTQRTSELAAPKVRDESLYIRPLETSIKPKVLNYEPSERIQQLAKAKKVFTRISSLKSSPFKAKRSARRHWKMSERTLKLATPKHYNSPNIQPKSKNIKPDFEPSRRTLELAVPRPRRPSPRRRNYSYQFA